MLLSQQRSFSQLPLEVQLEILTWLWCSPTTITQCLVTWNQVNRHWHQTISSPRFWKRCLQALISLIPPSILSHRLHSPSFDGSQLFELYQEVVNAPRGPDEVNGGKEVEKPRCRRHRWPHLRLGWRYCFLHCYICVVAQKCLLCGAFPKPYNTPFSELRPLAKKRDLPQQGRPRSPAQLEEQPKQGVCSSDELTAETFLQFPFFRNSVCTICLRRHFLLSTQNGDGRKEWALQQRQFFQAHGRWVVCLRRDIAASIPKTSISPRAMSLSSRGSAAVAAEEPPRPQLRTHSSRSRSSTDSPPTKTAFRPAVPILHGEEEHNGSVSLQRRKQQQQQAAEEGGSEQNRESPSLVQREEGDEGEAKLSSFSVRLFVARSMQAEQERYFTPAHRSHEEPPVDPLRFLEWQGHALDNAGH